MLARCDLHCHTKFSDRPSEWLLRRLGAAESYTDPLRLYQTCRDRGMSFVTISDHNEIRGALEIAHLPGTFVSNEVTTYFPEDGCKIHCLVFGIDERQFEDIQRVRASIYDLRDYLYDHGILYAVAHPLYSVNSRLGVEHVEKLLVLFKRFEAINGSRDGRAGTLVEAIFGGLDRDLIEALADRHGLDPRDGEPWRKVFTGGSDDHSGIYLAGAYTETPPARTVAEYLDHLRHGAHVPGGKHGSTLELAHSFYAITHAFYRERLLRGTRGDLVSELLERFLAHGSAADGNGGGVPPGARGLASLAMLRGAMSGWGRGRRGRGGNSDRVLIEGVSNLMALQRDGQRGERADATATSARVFAEASRMAHELGFAAVRKLAKQLRRGKLTEAVQGLVSLGPVTLCVAPYLAAFHTQHKDERMLERVAERFTAGRALARRGERRVWVADALGEVSGVATTVRSVVAEARRQGLQLTVATCGDALDDLGADTVAFPPVGRFKLPEYREHELAFPPLLDVVRWCEREKVRELIISTPGPLGLVALAAAKLLAIRTTGVYHTDFPLFVRHRTESETLEALTWRLMTWFFGQLDRVYVPSEAYRQRLIARGLEPSRLRAMRRGIDRARFTPERRDPQFWRRCGLRGEVVFLYVGRVAREKNLEALFDGFAALRDGGVDAGLAVVGDGPEHRRLSRRHAGRHVLFPGFLGGDELAAAYASADVFVFPSHTDTFGNAVLEAQAAGLPAIVSAHGGPREIVSRTGGGLVVEMDRSGALAVAMAELASDPNRRAALGVAGRQGSAGFEIGWRELVAEIWGEEPASAGASAGLVENVMASREPIFIPGVSSY